MMGIVRSARGRFHHNTDHVYHVERVREKQVSAAKILEIAFWGAVIWGFFRMMATYFHFTPYGLRVFSRPLLGIAQEDTQTGIVMGMIFFLGYVLLSTVIYSVLFAKFRVWWAGVLYGGAMFLIFGWFFNMLTWSQDTMSTELAWFLSFGLFIGMSLAEERHTTE